MESVEEMLYRDALRSAETNLWFLSLYVIVALPIIWLIYVYSYTHIMFLHYIPLGVRTALVIAIVHIVIGIAVLGGAILYYRFLNRVTDIYKILHLETFELHKYFLIASLVMVGVALLSGYILWVNAPAVGPYIGPLFNPRNVFGSVEVFSKLYMRHVVFEATYILIIFLSIILALIMSISLRVLDARTNIWSAEISAWLVWVVTILFAVYLFVHSSRILLIATAISTALLFILLGATALKLRTRFTELFSRREELLPPTFTSTEKLR